MKKAQVVAQVITVACPNCHEVMEDPFIASHLWEVATIMSGSVYSCEHCGEKYEMPKWVKTSLGER